MLASNYVDVQMVDTLAAILSVVNDNPVASLVKSLLLGNLGDGDHQMAEHGGVGLVGLAQLGEALSVFWDHQKVGFANWSNVSESQADIVFVNDVCWDFLGNNLVKNCHFLWGCGLGFFLFTHNYL